MSNSSKNKKCKKKKIKKPLTTGGFDHECATSLLQPQQQRRRQWRRYAVAWWTHGGWKQWRCVMAAEQMQDHHAEERWQQHHKDKTRSKEDKDLSNFPILSTRFKILPRLHQKLLHKPLFCFVSANSRHKRAFCFGYMTNRDIYFKNYKFFFIS